MKNTRSRNLPCWCGSGKKLKKCHLYRQSERPKSDGEANSALRASMQHKSCLHPDAGQESCSKGIINAHTIQRVGSLSAIAESGKVLSLGPARASTGRNSFAIEASEVGYRKASTVPALCDKHDKIFAPLENKAFRATKEQTFLAGYRAILLETHRKLGLLASMPLLRGTDRGQSHSGQRRIQANLDALEAGVILGNEDLRFVKSRYDQALTSGDFRDSRAIAFILDRPPNVMCTGTANIEFDMLGQRIQSLSDVTERAEAMTFSMIGLADGRGAAIFQWMGDSAPHRQLAATILSLDLQLAPDILFRYAFEHIENIHMKPSWWRSLDRGSRESLLDRALSGTPARLRTATSMSDDGVRAASFVVKEVVEA